MYDSLAAYYHLIFENWDASIARQAGVLGPLIEEACGRHPARILDAARRLFNERGTAAVSTKRPRTAAAAFPATGMALVSGPVARVEDR